MSNGTIFLYHAQASALGGVLIRPFTHVLESQAAISLSVSGGYGSARVSDYRFQELVSFREAYSQVSGSQNPDGSYSTVVSSTIEGLNVADMVTADRVVARLTTSHVLGESETTAMPLGTEFVNLRVAGYPIDPSLDLDNFCKLDTAEKFRKQYESDLGSKGRRFPWGDVDDRAAEWLRNRYRWQTKSRPSAKPKGMILCSLVKSIPNKAPGLEIYGPVIYVQDFGVIYLCEYQVRESARRLTMMRMELGSPFAGSLTVCDAEGNGLPFP